MEETSLSWRLQYVHELRKHFERSNRLTRKQQHLGESIVRCIAMDGTTILAQYPQTALI